MIEKILQGIAQKLQQCPFVQGIVLGGSRATGMAAERSDIDIGIYYDSGKLDYAQLNALAKELDDSHRENLICQEGGWGNWVNCGGWLKIGGCPVDLILRDMSRVKQVIEQTEQGKFSSHYQTGHPHAYLDVMYRGELASCRILYAREMAFVQLKQKAEEYPAALKKGLLDFFLFESGFSCSLAEKSVESGDVYYLAGHLFRAVSALNQVLFALNEQWCLNEKKAVFRIGTFAKKPDVYPEKVAGIFGQIGTAPADAVGRLKALRDEVVFLCSQA